MKLTSRLIDLKWWLQALPQAVFGGIDAAAGVMFELNVWCRRHSRASYYPVRQAIYELKNRMIRLLYRLGYCTSVHRQRQVQECWGVWENDYMCDEDCPKCGGTGIWREHSLLLFRFNVHGRHFSWHQPEDLVDWPVRLGDELNDLGGDIGIPDREPDVSFGAEEALRRAYVLRWALLINSPYGRIFALSCLLLGALALLVLA